MIFKQTIVDKCSLKKDNHNKMDFKAFKVIYRSVKLQKTQIRAK
jgi:hypothetical protein